MSTHLEIASAIARLSGQPHRSWSQIAERLNAERITTVRGHRFTEPTILYYKDLTKSRGYTTLRHERLSEARTKGRHTSAEWRAILARANGYCECCRQPCEKLQRDHIQQLYRGGSDAAENMRAVCRRCNLSRGPHLYPAYVHGAQV